MTKKIVPAFLHEKETATIMRMSLNWLRKCRANGTGPKLYKFGGSVRYSLRDVENYIEESRGGFSDPE